MGKLERVTETLSQSFLFVSCILVHSFGHVVGHVVDHVVDHIWKIGMCIEKYFASIVEVSSRILTEDALRTIPEECLDGLLCKDIICYSGFEGTFSLLAHTRK